VLSVEEPVPTVIELGEAKAVRVDCAVKATTDTLTVAVVEL
jgi:hypothetical protein